MRKPTTESGKQAEALRQAARVKRATARRIAKKSNLSAAEVVAGEDALRAARALDARADGLVKPRIVGAAGIKPLTPGQMHQLLRQHQPREWEGDARDAEEWAPCGACGGAVPVEAMRYSSPFGYHRGCGGLSSRESRAQAAVAEVVGVDLSLADAELVANKVLVPLYRDTEGSQPVHVKGRLPRRWGHVDAKALRRAVQNLPALRAQAGRTPHLCSTGPCCWCGTRLALGWDDHAHRWSDGSPAPMCRECSEVYERRGGVTGRLLPGRYDEQRVALMEALTGAPAQAGAGAPAGLRCFAEDHGPDDGTGERWGYLPGEAVEKLRWAEWGRFGGKYAPSEHRDEAVRRVREQERQQAERRAAEQAKTEAEARAAWGF